jgi:hypothetical protein
MRTSPQDILAAALREGRPRFFRAGGGAARGASGPQDTETFAENLMTLQECSILLGEKLNMDSVAYAYSYDGEETVGFCFDPHSPNDSPEVMGAIVNRRVPMVEFGESIRRHREP